MADIMKEDDEDLKTGTAGEEELVITEEKPVKADADGEDERNLKRDEEEDETGTDAERDVIRERRRREKAERKERRDSAISRDKLEMDFLRKRNDELEKRMNAQELRAHQADLGSLDQRLNRAQEEIRMAEQVIAKAVNAGNGDDVAKAMRYRDEAVQRAQQAQYAKQQVSQRQTAQPSGPQIDDLTLMHAKEFLSENKWYDPQGRDEDSAIVLAIDQALVKDGYDPKTEDYWDELRKRASRRLPEHFGRSKPGSTERTPRGGPAVGSGREHAPSSTRREVYISPERKQALVDAGVWDDPVLRMKYVKRYSEYDKQNRA